MDEFYGKQITIDGPVKFTGDPKDDPENDLAFQMWKRAMNEVYQPERSKREDFCVHEWICNVECGCGILPIYCKKCNEKYEHKGCGALNTMET